MIHNYYCTNCGQEMQGNDILFDLAQMLDLYSGADVSGIFIPFTPCDLKNKAEEMNVPLKGKVRLEITLKDILEYMSRDLDCEMGRQTMREMTFSQFTLLNIENLFYAFSPWTEENLVGRVRYFVDAIMARLMIREVSNDVADTEEWEENTANHYTYCWVEPIYFEGTDEIYTIKFSKEEDPVTLKFFENVIEIRGDCPDCRKPIIKDAGRYEHKLVGFLGAQSVGKTSLCIALINELPKIFGDLRISLPDPICLSDGMYDRLWRDMLLQMNGWTVPRADIQGAVAESYNASLLIDSVATSKRMSGKQISMRRYSIRPNRQLPKV